MVVVRCTVRGGEKEIEMLSPCDYGNCGCAMDREREGAKVLEMLSLCDTFNCGCATHREREGESFIFVEPVTIAQPFRERKGNIMTLRFVFFKMLHLFSHCEVDVAWR